MGMCASGYIFQAKVDELLGDIEDYKNYIYDVIVLSKDWFTKHIEQLRIIFGRLLASGLNVNDPKWSFGLKEIPYIGYLITREGIEPVPEKIQGIMDLGRPNATTEARALIGIVQ